MARGGAAASDDRVLRLQHPRGRHRPRRLPGISEAVARANGREVGSISSFAGSGTITNQIIMGVPAELALLSLELDASRLAERGIVARGSWRPLPHRRRRQPHALRHPGALRQSRRTSATSRIWPDPGCASCIRIRSPPEAPTGRSSRVRGGARSEPGIPARGDTSCCSASGGTSWRRPPRRARRGPSSRTGSATRSSRTSRKALGPGPGQAPGEIVYRVARS